MVSFTLVGHVNAARLMLTELLLVLLMELDVDVASRSDGRVVSNCGTTQLGDGRNADFMGWLMTQYIMENNKSIMRHDQVIMENYPQV